LQNSFSCNFNVLIHGHPKVLGVREILNEWILWRSGCIVREAKYDAERDAWPTPSFARDGENFA